MREGIHKLVDTREGFELVPPHLFQAGLGVCPNLSASLFDEVLLQKFVHSSFSAKESCFIFSTTCAKF